MSILIYVIIAMFGLLLGGVLTATVLRKYADKKRLAIEHAKYFLKDSPEYVDFFNNHKKKDDLSDSFLQGLYYLSKNYLKSN